MNSFFRTVKILLRYIVFSILDAVIVFRSPQIRKKTILLVRLDAVGDYLLFRNYIEIIKQDERFRNYEITLCGNCAWKDIADFYDSGAISKFCWIDRRKFYRNIFYRYSKLREITGHGYELVIHPNYSREFWYGDSVVKVVKAREKIGSAGDCTNIAEWQKRISDTYYTTLIPGSSGVIFEFYRNKEFFENLLGKKIDILAPTLPDIPVGGRFRPLLRYVALFIGAGSEYRRWSAAKFRLLAEYLTANRKLSVIVCGQMEDYCRGQEVAAQLEGVSNLCGQTTLIDIVSIIRYSEFVVSNESAAPHLATALGKRCIVISNGNHLCRFTPYPKEIPNEYCAVYHPTISLHMDKYIQIARESTYVSKFNIDDIDVNSVLARF